MPDHSNELFIDKLYLLKQEVLSKGYKWRLFSYGSSDEAGKIFHDVVGGRPAGLISSFQPSFEMKKVLKGNKIPAVFYDCLVRGFDSVVLDRKKGVYDAVRHLLKSGKRKILLLGCGLESERGEAYREAHLSFKIPVDDALIIDTPFGHDLFLYGYDEVKSRAGRTAFDAVLGVNDAAAIGAMRALAEGNLRIPQDVSVCGFDNIMASQYTVPALTTVSQPKEEMASLAIEFLLGRMNNFNLRRRTAKLQTSLLSRESC